MSRFRLFLFLACISQARIPKSKYFLMETKSKESQSMETIAAQRGIFQNRQLPEPLQTTPGCKCGVLKKFNKIVGGRPLSQNEYPWLVSIVLKRESTHFCGGTLLSSRTVLTAAHCKVLPNSKLKVLVGEHDLTKKDTEQKIGISSFIRHPKYNVTNLDYDFAIIQLSKDVLFSSTTRPICLPKKKKNYDNRKALAAGWGKLSSNGSNPNVPHVAQLDTLSRSACTTNTPFKKTQITKNMICAVRPGKDTCQEDSGGPLLVKEKYNYLSLVGVVSWGYGCAKTKTPGVYARVTSQLKWIKKQIKGTTCARP